jgi:hypothetical protein
MKDVLLLIRNAPREMTRICALAVLPALFTLNLLGDTIELKTGERIDGAFKQATSAGAVIEVAGQSITIPLEKVKAIYFGAAVARTPAGPAPSQEAMDALRALRSVTGSGIAYRDYAQRVLDTRVKVDRYLSSPGNDGTDLQEPIRVAMLEYELAAKGWLASSSPVEYANLWGPMGKILEDSGVSKCPVAKAIVYLRDNPQTASNPSSRKSKSTPTPARKQDPTEELGLLFAMKGDAPSTVWPCASGQLAEAERLLAPH